MVKSIETIKNREKTNFQSELLIPNYIEKEYFIILNENFDASYLF